LIRSEALAICDEPVAIDRAAVPRQRVGKSPTANRRGKYAMRAIASMPFNESIAYTESRIALLAMTEDAGEGLKAFGEKRKTS
jgi:enoyl-CoA hydratase/carnithine racemase